MKKLVVAMIAAAVVMSMPRTAMAQGKTVHSEMKTETATVEAIEASTRTVTLKRADGTFVEIVAAPEIKRLAELKVGDTVTATYYENVVVRLKQPGESEVLSGTRGTSGSQQDLPGGTSAKQVTVTATITAIDSSTPSITFAGPNGWKYTSRVQDPTLLEKVKVGDKFDIVWTQATLVSVERK